MWSPSLAVLLLASFTQAIPHPKPPTVKRPGLIQRRNAGASGTTHQTQPWSQAPQTSAPKANIWASLSIDEAVSIKDYLHKQADLNLTAVEDAGAWDNTILVVDTIAPNKSDALAYLDGKGAVPPRWALASILFGQYEEPYVQTFAVGPLPISDKTMHFPDTFHSTAPDAKIRVYDQTPSGSYMRKTVIEIVDIVNDLLDGKITNATDFSDEFSLWGIDPLWHEDGKVINWVQIWRKSPEVELPSGNTFAFDDGTLLPQGLYFGFDITGRDTSKWSLLGVYYAGNFYPSLAAFRAAYSAPGFIKLKPVLPGAWSATDKVEPGLPYETLPPPQQIQPGGQRFEVDFKQKYVKWMDFEFYITFTRDTGVRFYDIKYKGERIIYELGLQEAVAHYAGQDPVQSGIGYLDSYYGFGPYAFNLVPGFDVPLYAQCMEATYHEGEQATTHGCGITIFEQDQNYPMARHTTGDYVAITKNPALTVRVVNTIGNYDYEFDYTFFLDGTLEVLVRASGYIQSAYYANNTDYGYQIHDQLSGSMHDHILSFKADVDIAGTDNTMVKHVFEAAEVKYPWSNVTKSTMKLGRYDVKNENEAKMKWSPNAREQVLIVNKDAKNKYGEERGYKMMPSRGGGMYTTITNSTNLKNSQEFAKEAYYVTKYKDSETHITSPWNAYDVERPLINFGTYFDGESLEQEDIVTWFNLGMHHVPHTGDLPNTVFTTAQSAMVFTPHNYLLGDPSQQSSQRIRINYDDEKATDVEKFGQQLPSGSVDLQQVAWNPWTYYGDYSTRKFPYQGPIGDEGTEDVTLGNQTTTGGSPTR